MNFQEQQTQVVQAIDKIAEKLQVPTEKLWSVMVSGAKVQVWTTVYLTVSAIVYSLVWLWLFKRAVKYAQDPKVDNDISSAWILGCVALGVVAIVVDLYAVLGAIPSAIAAANAPEYWALNEIVSAIKD